MRITQWALDYDGGGRVARSSGEPAEQEHGEGRQADDGHERIEAPAASQQARTPLVVIGVSRGPTATIEKAFRAAEKLATGKARHGQVWEVARIEVKPSNPHPREVRVTLLTTTGG